MTPFRFWLSSVAIIVAAFYLLPNVRDLIWFLFVPYLAVFVWGIFDLRSQFFVKAFIRNKYETAGVCLTFDDGPDPELTNDVCGLLSRFAMKATFFVIGEKAREHSSLVKLAHDRGHVIASHDLSHSAFSNFRFSSTMINDIMAARKIIENIIGKKPLLYRPPVGLANPHLGTALARLSMQCVGWSVRARDRGNRRIDKIRRIALLRVKAGDVIMLHDCLPKPQYKKEYLEQLEKLLETIKAKGLATLGVDEMFDVPAYEKND
jgi:peptidoglycan/xylan/chitin deacetylase (PgdA/CDA1 family)